MSTVDSQTKVDPLIKQWTGLRMAHEAVMVEDARAVLANERQAVKTHRTHMATGPNGEQADEGTEDMGDIRIGDVVNHYHQLPRAQTAVPAPTSVSPNPSFAKIATLAAALAAGAGIPAAGAITYLAMRPGAAAVDADREWELRLLPADKPRVLKTPTIQADG